MVTESKFIVRVQRIRKVFLKAKLLKVREPTEALNGIAKFQFVIKITENDRGVRKKALAEQMVPAESTRHIPPLKTKVIIEIKHVSSCIKSHEKTVAVI